mmetsp:Transcript_16204/g.34220  ORF Transcript_16204/g.34220 Transcript_16204/m.34220 type:complete len:91 (+) Transcript_16204:217-489(+)|eukprot:CAMPEP_0184438244 /NCGR_PEP_ID=MMETSP0738-20130409/642029_1 /TAXON_ID=385413 /ORGANISM="Thalassiosira miniscula, Strain CCMP1093" /LENGTH=90 /DNA_ID=CAMNT_0026805513 /DNA_START=136 /DNA_END=408 /DNA_ORIENTATION=+
MVVGRLDACPSIPTPDLTLEKKTENGKGRCASMVSRLNGPTFLPPSMTELGRVCTPPPWKGGERWREAVFLGGVIHPMALISLFGPNPGH